MRPLAAKELVHIWEQGRHDPPWRQALLLLDAACPETPTEALLRLSIGRRDGLLLQLREWTFGSRLACTLECSACGERLEFTADSSEIRIGPQETPEAIDFRTDGYRATFRLPNTADLAALSGIEDVEAARDTLLAACLVALSTDPAADIPTDESAGPIRPLPPEVQDRIIQRMREADPMADIRIALTCPACDHRWTTSLDPVSFFWQEIEDWAWRTLREIHTLASAYGWSESEILETSAWRRRAYLQMVQA